MSTVVVPSLTKGGVRGRVHRFTLLRLLFSRAGTPHLGGSHRFSFNKPDGMCSICNGIGVQVDVDVTKLVDKDLCLGEGAILHPYYRQLDGYLMKSMKLAKVVPWDVPVREFTPKQLKDLLYGEKLTVKLPGAAYNAHFEGIVTAIRRRHKQSTSNSHAAMVSALTTRVRGGAATGKGRGKGKGKGKGTGNGAGSGGGSSEWGQPKGTLQQLASFFTSQPCDACDGQRLNQAARSVRYRGKGIGDLASMEISALLRWFESFSEDDDDVKPITLRLRERLRSLEHIGVGYVRTSWQCGVWCYGVQPCQPCVAWLAAMR